MEFCRTVQVGVTLQYICSVFADCKNCSSDCMNVYACLLHVPDCHQKLMMSLSLLDRPRVNWHVTQASFASVVNKLEPMASTPSIHLCLLALKKMDMLPKIWPGHRSESHLPGPPIQTACHRSQWLLNCSKWYRKEGRKCIHGMVHL